MTTRPKRPVTFRCEWCSNDVTEERARRGQCRATVPGARPRRSGLPMPAGCGVTVRPGRRLGQTPAAAQRGKRHDFAVESVVRISLETYQQYLWLDLSSRAFPNAETAWDRDAITTQVTAYASPFRGTFATILFSHELLQLYRLLVELHRQVSGVPVAAIFCSREEVIELSFDVSRRGELTLGIALRESATVDTVLRYAILADQTYLLLWAEAIRIALQEFPPQIEAHPLPDPLKVGNVNCRESAELGSSLG